MANAARIEADYVTPAEYLAIEVVSVARHEYLADAVYAMSGTTVAHRRIISNLDRELGQQLRGYGCEAFTSEIKVCIQVGGDCFYC